MDAVIDLATAFGETPEMLVDLLTGLANKSLVSVDQSVSAPRYRLLESVREFALGQLRTLGDERRAREAHLAYVLHMTEAAQKDLAGGRMRERITSLMQEHGNIESAANYAVVAADDRQAALQIAGSLNALFQGTRQQRPWRTGMPVCSRGCAVVAHASTRTGADVSRCRQSQ